MFHFLPIIIMRYPKRWFYDLEQKGKCEGHEFTLPWIVEKQTWQKVYRSECFKCDAVCVFSKYRWYAVVLSKMGLSM